MKRFLIIAAVAAMFVPLTGCDNKPTQWEAIVTRLKSIEEKTDTGVTTLTEYAWTEEDAPAGVKYFVGAVLIYQDADYTYSGKTATFYRTIYTDGVVSDRQKRVVEYADENWSTIKSLNVYQLDLNGSETSPIPIESMTETYDAQGRLIKYEHKENDQLVTVYDGYLYSSVTKWNIWDHTTTPATQTVSTTRYVDGNSDMIDTIVITTPDGVQLEYTRYLYSYGVYYTGYETYRTENLKNYLVEVQSDYTRSSDYSTVTFKTTWYDEDGVKVIATKDTKRTYTVSKVIITM